MNPFSITMIMKNEEKYIDKFFLAIEKIFDGYQYEVVINDTGSNDNSVEIAIKHGAKVIHSEWKDDFSFSRNLAVNEASYDTIIVLDCDEFVTGFNPEKVFPASPDMIGRLRIRNFFVGSDGDDSYTTYLPRIYDRRYSRFEGAIHEQIIPMNKALPKYYDADLSVDHFGYYGKPEELAKKTEKYERILLSSLKDNPQDPYTLFQLGQNHNMMRDPEGAIKYYRMGMSMNPDVSLEYVRMMITSLGNNLIRIGRPEEAAELNIWSEKLNRDADFLCMLGLAYLRTGKYMESMQKFLSALAAGDSKTDGASTYIPLYNMGIINEILGNKDGALSLYRQCGDYKPALEKIRELI